ncbi:hypothetical protein J602_1345 [Acinetobacter baumannii 1417041]|nr:hypothetical protein J602_1345 [Acinetobacter baumannii 1417041]
MKEAQKKQFFLNHLCDEEQSHEIDFMTYRFLNHLCDEEQDMYLKNVD